MRVGHFKEDWKRSLIKTATYRIFIVILDFLVVYLLTGRTDVALAFMLASNAYTTVAYYVHERAWDRITWGKDRAGARRSLGKSAKAGKSR